MVQVLVFVDQAGNFLVGPHTINLMIHSNSTCYECTGTRQTLVTLNVQITAGSEILEYLVCFRTNKEVKKILIGKKRDSVEFRGIMRFIVPQILKRM